MALTAGEIRETVLRALAVAAGQGRDATYTTPLARGPNWVRRGRWAIADTTTPGILVAAEIDRELGVGAAVYVGPAAALRSVVPAPVRLAWITAQYGEEDTDP